MPTRWLATVHYKSKIGTIPVDHDIEELDEIWDLVEAGPDWNAIEKIEIVLQRGAYGRIVTLEEVENYNEN